MTTKDNQIFKNLGLQCTTFVSWVEGENQGMNGSVVKTGASSNKLLHVLDEL